jgi:ribosomal protein S18 acetylase RimI-like enzyme
VEGAQQEPRIRPAAEADLAAIQAVERAAGRRFADAGMPEIAAQPPRDRAALAAGVARGLLVVMDDPRSGLVGFALARPLARSLHLEEVSVLPEHGRRGLGAALVCHVAGLGRARGLRRLTLATFADVPWNRPWYERLGFRVLADDEQDADLRAVRREEAAAGLPVDARVVMSLPLDAGPGR